jgi:hypothetical protein
MIALAPLPVSVNTCLEFNLNEHRRGQRRIPTRSRWWSIHWSAMNRWRLARPGRPGLLADTACWIFVEYAILNENAFFEGYIDAAIWFSPSDEQGRELNTDHGPEDLAECTQHEMGKDCYHFLQQASPYLDMDDDAELKDAGQDFFLTRNRHGAGFWDGDWDHKSKDAVAELTAIAKSFGEWNLYAGDDNLLYSL